MLLLRVVPLGGFLQSPKRFRPQGNHHFNVPAEGKCLLLLRWQAWSAAAVAATRPPSCSSPPLSKNLIASGLKRGTTKFATNGMARKKEEKRGKGNLNMWTSEVSHTIFLPFPFQILFPSPPFPPPTGWKKNEWADWRSSEAAARGRGTFVLCLRCFRAARCSRVLLRLVLFLFPLLSVASFCAAVYRVKLSQVSAGRTTRAVASAITPSILYICAVDVRVIVTFGIILCRFSQGFKCTVELKNGEVYRGLIVDSEDNWNLQMQACAVTDREGKVLQSPLFVCD